MKKYRLVERLAWIAGLVLVGIWAVFWVHSQVGRRSDLRKFEEEKVRLRTTSQPASQPAGPAAEPTTTELKVLSIQEEVDYSLWAEGRIREYEESLTEEAGVPEAILRIPKLDLEVAVLEGTSDLVLNRGVGRIEGTAEVGETGNLGLAGHRDGFFRGLEDIQPGDTMDLETLTSTRRYVIDKISIVSPEEVWVLDPSDEARITLVTCYPFYFVGKAPLRYIVHSHEIPIDPAIAQKDSESAS